MIECRGISKHYRLGDNESVSILNSVDLTIQQGEFVAIIGPSGSGKSTLMNIMGLLDRPTHGDLLINGINPHTLSDHQMAALRSREIGFVFQQFNLLPRTSALDNVTLPSLYFPGGHPNATERATALLTDVGLVDRLTHTPAQLSGGQQQRVAIARAMMNNPNILFADEPTGNLDTKSQGEIMALFKELHRLGKTIILVTHDHEVADMADRVITLRDGAIFGDGQSINTDRYPISTATLSTARSGFSQWFRRLAADGRLAVQSMKRNGLRTVLSMLGILIGVASLIAMLGLGAGAKQDIEKKLAGLGSNLLIVSPGAPRVGAVSMDAGSGTRLDIADADYLLKNIREISRVSPTVTGRVRVKFKGKNASTTLMGVLPQYEWMRAMSPTDGHFFNAGDNRGRHRVALIGLTVAKNLFGDIATGELTISPIGKTLLVDRTLFTIIGILPEKGSTGFRDNDDVVVVPLSTAMNRVLGKTYVDAIEVEVTRRDQMETTQQTIIELMMKRHRMPPGQEDGLRIRNMTDIQDAMAQTSQTMSILLASIAAISMGVGGIGVMNIMLVTVIERTREIGLRKAIGATPSAIMAQFLVEAILISGSGGIIGILLGVGIIQLLSSTAGWLVVLTPPTVLYASLFSVLSGVTFGFWPAKKAASLNPIESLRHE